MYSESEPKNKCKGADQMVVYQHTNIIMGNMGDDNTLATEGLSDAEACADKCFQIDGCVGFAYWPSDSAYAGCYPKSSTAGGIIHGSAVGDIFGSGLTSGVLCDGSTAKEVMPNGGKIYYKGEHRHTIRPTKLLVNCFFNHDFIIGVVSQLH